MRSDVDVAPADPRPAAEWAKHDVVELVAGATEVDARTQEQVTALLEHGRALDDLGMAWERLRDACWVCGCAVDRACEEGCGWAAANLCTSCVNPRVSGVGGASA